MATDTQKKTKKNIITRVRDLTPIKDAKGGIQGRRRTTSRTRVTPWSNSAVWSFYPFARIKSFSSEEVTLFRQESSSRCERILGNVAAQGGFHVGNHVDPHHKRKHSEAWLEIRSRYYLYSAVAAGLAAADDLAHAGDANRIAWSNLVPAGARRFWRKTFLYLEIPNNRS